MLAAFQDAPGRTDDDGVGCVVRGEGGRVMSAPGVLAAREERRDFLAGHRRSFCGARDGREVIGANIGLPALQFNRTCHIIRPR